MKISLFSLFLENLASNLYRNVQNSSMLKFSRCLFTLHAWNNLEVPNRLCKEVKVFLRGFVWMNFWLNCDCHNQSDHAPVTGKTPVVAPGLLEFLRVTGNFHMPQLHKRVLLREGRTPMTISPLLFLVEFPKEMWGSHQVSFLASAALLACQTDQVGSQTSWKFFVLLSVFLDLLFHPSVSCYVFVFFSNTVILLSPSLAFYSIHNCVRKCEGW